MLLNSTIKEFQNKQEELISLCLTISKVVLKSDFPYAKNVSILLSEVADILINSDSLKEKREAAGSVRRLFHRDGINDWPGPIEDDKWNDDLKKLYDLSTIYSEVKYIKVFTEQSAHADAIKGGA